MEHNRRAARSRGVESFNGVSPQEPRSALLRDGSTVRQKGEENLMPLEVKAKKSAQALVVVASRENRQARMDACPTWDSNHCGPQWRRHLILACGLLPQAV
jgi:hypothetical protein